LIFIAEVWRLLLLSKGLSMAYFNMQTRGGGAGGSDVFGRRLSAIPLPDPMADLQRAGINTTAINPAASAAVQAGFNGQLAPGTINSIQDAAAQWSAASGMPGFSPGSLGYNRGLRDLGLTAEKVKDQAFSNYGQLAGTVSGTQTVRPELQYERNLQNESSAAAPFPTAANSYAQSLFDKYLQSLQGASSGGDFKYQSGRRDTGNHYDVMPWVGGAPSGQWNRMY
jgi:hypothetical protein